MRNKIYLPDKLSPPAAPSLGAAFFITTPQNVKVFIINQNKMHFFCIFFDILTSFSSLI